MTIYDPENWMESMVRGLKDYVLAAVDAQVYDVVMEFPGPALDSSKMPLSKTIIHFEADDVLTVPLGMGDYPVEWNYDAVAHSVDPQWAAMQRVNFDVGVWSSDRSGGTTSRMRAVQILNRLFGFPNSTENLRIATDGGEGGLEILAFSAGRFALDTVNDVTVFRSVGGQLEIRSYSRTLRTDTPGPAIEEIVQNPNLTILG